MRLFFKNFKNKFKNLLRDMQESEYLTKRNIIAFLFLGILVLSIPLGMQAIRKQQILKSGASEGALCTYPEECDASDGSAGTRTCNGTEQSGVCKFDNGVDPACSSCVSTGTTPPASTAPAPSSPTHSASSSPTPSPSPITAGSGSACTNHQPQAPSYYDTFESPDSFGEEIRDDKGNVIGRTKGWLPSVGHLHLNGMHAWGETDRNPDGSNINPSYKLTYREVINNPCFTYAVKTMDEFFSIPNLKTGSAGRTYCDEASYDPGLGRGDPRKFDPAERVSYYINAPRSHVDPPTGRQTSQTDVAGGDPVAWLVVNKYWSDNIYYFNGPAPKTSACLAIQGTAVAKPTALTAVCSADNRTAALSWASDGAKFDLRVDGPAAYPAQANNCSPHSICLNDFTAKNITVNVTAGGTVSYWLNAKNAAGAPGETSDIKTFSCGGATSSTKPAKPTSLSASCNGNQATISWTAPSSGTFSYDVRVDGPATFSKKDCGPSNVCVRQDQKSITVNLDDPNAQFSAWVHTVDQSNVSDPSDILKFSCKNSAIVSPPPTHPPISTINPAAATCIDGAVKGKTCVDATDFVEWFKEWSGLSNAKDADFFPLCNSAGSRGDGIIDIADFEIWRREFGGKNKCL